MKRHVRWQLGVNRLRPSGRRHDSARRVDVQLPPVVDRVEVEPGEGEDGRTGEKDGPNVDVQTAAFEFPASDVDLGGGAVVVVVVVAGSGPEILVWPG